MQISRIFVSHNHPAAPLELAQLPADLTVLYDPAARSVSPLASFLHEALRGLEAHGPPAPRAAGAPAGSVDFRYQLGSRTLQRRVELAGGTPRVLDEQSSEVRFEPTGSSSFVTPIAHWNHVFWLGGGPDLDLSRLLDQAWERGFELARAPAAAERVSELEQQLQQLQESLARIPRHEADLAWLRDRQRHVQAQLAAAEAGEGRAFPAHDPARLHLLEESAHCRRELTRLAVELDAQRRSAPPTAETHRSPVPQEGWHDLRALEARLARWQTVLQEVTERRQNIEQAQEEQQDNSRGNAAAPRVILRRLEQRLETLQNKLPAASPTAPAACQCQTLVPLLPAALRMLRDEVYQLCGSLSAWESRLEGSVRQQELQELRRCEEELRRAIHQLLRQRRQLEHPSSSSTDDPVLRKPQDAARCECAAHPAAPIRRELHASSLEPAGPPAEAADTIEQRRALQEEIAAMQRRLTACEQALQSRYSHTPPPQDVSCDNLRSELRRLALALEQHEQRRALADQVQEIEAELQQLRSRDAVPPIVREANQYLERLSGGELRALTIHANRSWTVTDRRSQVRGSTDLGPAEHEQVYLSLALALAAAWRRRGVRPPLICDEPLRQLQGASLTAAAELLVAAAGQGQQILVFTREAALAEQLRQAGAEVRTLAELPAPSTIPPEVKPQAARPRDAREFFLTEEHPIEDAPSIDSLNATRLRQRGILKIRDLLALTPEAALALESLNITGAMIACWQAEARLVCRVPRLRPYDARILVACGICDPDQLDSIDPDDLRDRVLQFARTSDGQILLGVGTREELARILEWIGDAQIPTFWSRTRDPHRLAVVRYEPAAGDPDASEATAPRFSERAGTPRRPERTSREPTTPPHPTESSAAPSTTPPSPAAESRPLRFRLHVRDTIADAPSIGRRTASQLEGLGIYTVADLLRANPDQLAERCGNRRIKGATIRNWQQQASLACRVPELRGHDVQILVACGIAEPDELRSADAQQLLQRVHRYLETPEGRRTLRQGAAPDATEIRDWIRWASHARSLRAA